MTDMELEMPTFWTRIRDRLRAWLGVDALFQHAMSNSRRWEAMETYCTLLEKRVATLEAEVAKPALQVVGPRLMPLELDTTRLDELRRIVDAHGRGLFPGALS